MQCCHALHLGRAQPWHCCPQRMSASILCSLLQVFSERGSSSPRCAPTSELYDICLVQTDLLEAISDEDYFLRCVRRCEENYDSYLARMESGSLSQQGDGQ